MEASELADLLVESGALQFGDFVTKSGRRAPYFVNTGRLSTGGHIAALGRAFADEVMRSFGPDVDAIYGPAYKGIPLAVATVIALAERHHAVAGYCFDRKEAKGHGEGGLLVGHQLAAGDRVVIVEDVTTAGTSIREGIPKLRAIADVEIVGVVVALDRREKSPGSDRPALAVLEAEFDVRTRSLAKIDDVIRILDQRGDLSAEDLNRTRTYLNQHGA